MQKRRYGTGYVFRRTFRDRRTGKLKEVSNYSIAYPTPEGERREVTQTDSYTEACNILRQRLAGEMPVQTALRGGAVKIDTLAQLLETDYKQQQRKSWQSVKVSRLPHLTRLLASTDLRTMKQADVLAYRDTRLKEGASNATVNRELAALKRGLKLAVERELLTKVAPIKLLKESAPRKGFFEYAELQELLKHLDPWWHDLTIVAYITGWRVKSELCPMVWSQVDFVNRVLRLEPGMSKNDEAREFPFTPRLEAALRRQREVVNRLEARMREEQGRTKPIKLVFPRHCGKQLSEYSRPFKVAAEKAGLDRIPHDFRRTAVRNLELAGVDRATAMKMVGHKTEAIYRRYNIVDKRRLDLAAAQLSTFQDTQVNL